MRILKPFGTTVSCGFAHSHHTAVFIVKLELIRLHFQQHIQHAEEQSRLYVKCNNQVKQPHTPLHAILCCNLATLHTLV